MGAHVLHKGASSINLDGFNPVTFLGAIQEYKVHNARVVTCFSLYNLTAFLHSMGFSLYSTCGAMLFSCTF